MLGTLERRSSSAGWVSGLAGGVPAAGLSGAATDLSVLLNSDSHFSFNWSAWLSVGELAGALGWALNWLLAGALTCAIEPAVRKTLRVVIVTVATNKPRIVRQRSARLSRVVVNAISLLPRSIEPVTQTPEANSDSPTPP